MLWVRAASNLTSRRHETRSPRRVPARPRRGRRRRAHRPARSHGHAGRTPAALRPGAAVGRSARVRRQSAGRGRRRPSRRATKRGAFPDDDTSRPGDTRSVRAGLRRHQSGGPGQGRTRCGGGGTLRRRMDQFSREGPQPGRRHGAPRGREPECGARAAPVDERSTGAGRARAERGTTRPALSGGRRLPRPSVPDYRRAR